MILMRERSGDTLSGVIDGSNKFYYTSFSFAASTVNVYLNGVLLVRALANGFSVTEPNEVEMKEAPLPGDTLEVEYKSSVCSGGGADGGIPEVSNADSIEPILSDADNLEPIVVIGD